MSTKKTVRLLASPTKAAGTNAKLPKKSPNRSSDSATQPVDLSTSLPPPRQAVKRRRSPVVSSASKTSSRTRPPRPPSSDLPPDRNSGSAESAVSFTSQSVSPESSFAATNVMASLLSRLNPPTQDAQLKMLEDQSRLIYYYCNLGGNAGGLMEPGSMPGFQRGKDSATSVPHPLLLPSTVADSNAAARSSSASLTGDSPVEGLTRQTSSVSSSDELNDSDAPLKQRGRRNYKNMTRERRIEANARERTRVHTIGAAFETLRQTVPAYSNNQKLSKLAILRIACSYILSLSRLADLDYSADQSQPEFSQCMNQLTQTIQTEGKMRRS